MSSPAPRPGILKIDPYVGGESETAPNPALGRTIRLASNESALGPSPAAMEAYSRLAPELHRYPDGASRRLREAIGRRFGLDPARIVCGAGSDELIQLLVKAYAGPGDEVLFSRHGFLMYPIAARSAGATPVAAPETGLRADVGQILALAGERTRLVFLANPNNPTGSHLTPQETARLAAGLPETAVLALDSAYAEYVEQPDYEPGTALVDRADNVVMLRTFSKIFGLGALRLGWIYAPPAIVDVLNRIRGPFSVSAAAQAAGVAALEDTAFTERVRRETIAARQWTTERLGALGLRVHPSAGNFVLVDFAGRADAETVRLGLKADGILVRQMGAYGLPTCLRVTIGTAEEMEVVAASLARRLEEAAG